MRRGKFVILFGPTGSGKSLLIEHAREHMPEAQFAASYTNREKRAVQENQSYRYISTEAFEEKINQEEFLEWAQYGGGLYGTLKEEVETGLAAGKIVIKEMEIQGIEQTLNVLPREEVCLIYIDAGSWEELARRVRARAPIEEEELEKRRLRFEKEIVFKEQHADMVVHNPEGKLEEAKKDFIVALENIREEIK